MPKPNLRTIPFDDFIRTLAARLRAKKPAWTGRDVCRASWIFRKGGGDAFLDSCLSRGLGRWVDFRPGPKGGRPVRKFVFCDPVAPGAVDQTAAASTEPTKAVAVGGNH